MSVVDHQPAAGRMAELVRNVPDSALGRPTPCRDYRVADLLDHIHGLTVAFTDAANKATARDAPAPRPGDGRMLPADWRTRIPAGLDALVAAWQDPAAYEGVTRAGGIDMPGEVAAVVALEELVVHGWDLARATGQPFGCGDAEVATVEGFISQFAGPDQAELRGSAYAAPVEVAAESSPLDKVVALSGRDPRWTAG